MLKANSNPIDLGKLKFGKPHHFSFEVKNEGEKEVEITKLSVGCTSCTKALTSIRFLRPNQTATINVTYTPGSLGEQKKFVNVSYEGTSLRLEFTANVES